ncbi:hypothetical protein D3C87_918840 [compost metagenome]
MAEILDRIDQPISRRTRLPGAHAIEHLRQAIMPALHQRKQLRRRLQSAAGKTFVKVFQLMREVADRADLDHPRATLEGVQIAQQGFHFLTIARLGLPAQQRGAGVFDDVETFFEEDFQQLGIVASAVVPGCCWRSFGNILALADLTDNVDQILCRGQWLMLLQLFKQQRQTLMTLEQQAPQAFAVVVATIHQAFVKAFQLLSQIANGLDFGHPRAALEGVQIALQRGQRRGIVRVAQPALQGLA